MARPPPLLKDVVFAADLSFDQPKVDFAVNKVKRLQGKCQSPGKRGRRTYVAVGMPRHRLREAVTLITRVLDQA